MQGLTTFPGGTRKCLHCQSLLLLWLKRDNSSNILAYLPWHRQYIKILQERSRQSEVG